MQQCAKVRQNCKVKLEIGLTSQYIAAVVQAKLAVEQFCMRFSLSSSSDALTYPRGSNFFSPASTFDTCHPRWLVCLCSHSFRANREAHVGLILLPYVRVLFAVNMAAPTFFLRPYFSFLSCFAYIGCGQGVFGLHVEAMSAQCIH